eukprot:gnl/TRDRNA2_/TRDRNA2_180766_c0_seq1.p1 gnl/TRDRNA2_/TRDRNA2_180766_c0~~gnl/TRDRNA2_/TRDRNA2_180766_c0_seq1.p1  ORF type:complete len:432 (-),score=84.78 gnl/TRDRNA2_/TRDRNA2_180766_c0_seq1:214-1509(-)
MFGEDSAGNDRTTRRVPHYAMKTVTHSAPEFVNHEQDMIRQSFSCGNYTWMKEALPVELGPDAVNMLRRQRMERNRLADPLPQTWTKMTQLWGGGYYQEFEYMPDPYTDGDPMLKLRGNVKEKREKIANHDWRYPSQEKRLKHETMINDPRNKETYPYLGGNMDEELQPGSYHGRGTSSKDGSFSSTSQSSFVAGRGNGLDDNSRMSRMTLPMMVSRLQKRLAADWEDMTVVVSVTDQDLVQIAFHMATVDSERGVLAYMNVLSKDVELLGSLGLRKVSQLWGLKRDFSSDMQASLSKDDGDGGQDSANLEHVWTFFLLMPKWVRMRSTDAYYTVHPRSQGSAFRMSTAGSSVLLSLGSSVLDPAELAKRGSTSHGGSTHRDSTNRELPSATSARGVAQNPMKVDLSLIEKAVSTLPAISERSGRPPGGGS